MKRAAPFEVRSNMKRSTSYRFLMEMQMEYSFEKNVRADFLVSLMAPLHRQYKTARTELAGICY